MCIRDRYKSVTIESGWFSKCGSRFGAAHVRFTHVQELHGLRAAPFQNVAIASAPRTLVLQSARVPWSRVSEMAFRKDSGL
eukprot:9428406-Pyramimonas_sp.AAC.1